jgi:hypothetical protein
MTPALKNAVGHVLVEVAADTLRCGRLVHGPVFLEGWGHVGCAHGPMPVGETGGAKVRGGKAGGGSPRLHKRLCARKLGETGFSGVSLALDRREGAAPPSSEKCWGYGPG